MARDKNGSGPLNIPATDTGGEWEAASAEDSVSEFVDAQLGLDVLQRFGAKKGGGRRATKPPLHFEFKRDLTLDDALVMQAAPARKVGETGGVASIQRIRTIHHQIARMLVDGAKIVHISAALGVTPARIQQLKNDPAFQELLSHYEDQEEQARIDLQQRFRFLGTLGMEELQDRLMEEPDSFGNGHLMDLVKLTVGGEAPRADAKQSSGGMSKEDLEKLKQNADSNSRGNITYRKNGDLQNGETTADKGA